jgi:hypothetical protein
MEHTQHFHVLSFFKLSTDGILKNRIELAIDRRLHCSYYDVELRDDFLSDGVPNDFAAIFK